MVHGKGLTVWTLTDQVADVDSRNVVTGRIGYMLDDSHLEPFIGSTWNPGGHAPQVMSIGLIRHASDLIDPDNPLPWIPEIALVLITEDVVATPYIAAQATFNFIDEDSGFYGGFAGVLIKTSPEAKSEVAIEARYAKAFGDLESIPDEELLLSLGLRIRF